MSECVYVCVCVCVCVQDLRRRIIAFLLDDVEWLHVRFLMLQERCLTREKSRVERLKAKVEPLLLQVAVDIVSCVF